MTEADDSRKDTEFTNVCGIYEFVWVPFSIYVTPNFLALMINETKRIRFLFSNLDDMVIFSKCEKEHLDHL